MNAHGISDETVLSRTADVNGSLLSVTLRFTIPAASDYFDGHFPQFKLLPAVAQFDIVTSFAEKYFGVSRFIPSIRRIKFSARILPDTTAVLSLTAKDSSTFIYELSQADKNTAADSKRTVTFSSGSFTVENGK